MKHSIFVSVIWLSLLTTISADEAIWFPTYGNPNDENVSIHSIGQKGSEVYLVQHGPGTFVDMFRKLTTTPLPITFPSIFIVRCISAMEIGTAVGEFDNIIYGGFPPDVRRKYKYDIGTGWIYHQKGNLKLENPRFLQSLGWMYINEYPWVYGLDFGWRYVIEAGIAWNSNSWWFYEPEFGWFWTTRDMYPSIYHADNGWVYYDEQ